MTTGLGYQRLDKEYAEKLQNTSANDNYNETGNEDMIFIMNFMTGIKTDNHS